MPMLHRIYLWYGRTLFPICVGQTFATVLVQGERHRRYIPLADWPADARLTVAGDYKP